MHYLTGRHETKFMKASILYFIFILFSHVGYAQWENQIPNYSFENVTIDYPSSSNINNLTNYKLDKDTAHHDKNAVFGEVFGGGGYYSVGFERTLITYDNYDFSINYALGWQNLNNTCDFAHPSTSLSGSPSHAPRTGNGNARFGFPLNGMQEYFYGKTNNLTAGEMYTVSF